MIKKAVLALAAIMFAVCSHAVPIVITQTYNQVAYHDYGMVDGVAYGQAPVDGWIFKGTVDSEAVKIAPWPGAASFALTSLTITQAALGLFDVGIVNVPLLWFYPDRFGFTSSPDGGHPWTVVVYEEDHFLGANTLAEYLARITVPLVHHEYTSFGPQWDGYLLEDGRRLYGWGFGGATPVVGDALAIPEPASLPLMLAGLALLVLRARIRR